MATHDERSEVDQIMFDTRTDMNAPALESAAAAEWAPTKQEALEVTRQLQEIDKRVKDLVQRLSELRRRMRILMLVCDCNGRGYEKELETVEWSSTIFERVTFGAHTQKI